MRRGPALLLGGAGLVTVLAGTFLPWLRSGGVLRNSYTSFGLLRRLIGFHGLAEALLRGWPLLGAVAAAVVLIALGGWHRTAAGLAVAVAAWSAAVAGGALARSPVGTVRVDAVGPSVTVLGAIATVTAATLILISPVRPGMGGTERDRAAQRTVRSER